MSFYVTAFINKTLYNNNPCRLQESIRTNANSLLSPALQQVAEWRPDVDGFARAYLLKPAGRGSLYGIVPGMLYPMNR
jgi:hypothetical protein